LGATGVSARDVKKQSGFEVVYGPIRAKDIPEFLKNNRKTKGNMRKVTFSFIERLILTPIELKAVLKPVLIIAIVLFIISGFGPGFFSFSNAWTRGLTAIIFLFTGILSGAVITPALLPFIPFREFAAKGIISGIAVSGLSILMVSPSIGGRAFLLSLSLFTIVISSILAMNFTGATPFTSPSGVEKEMRRFLPIQAIIIVVSTGLWIYSAF
jgi:DMSO reductase anchor subunit